MDSTVANPSFDSEDWRIMIAWPWSTTPTEPVHVTWHCPTCHVSWDRKCGTACWCCSGDGMPGPIPSRLTSVPYRHG